MNNKKEKERECHQSYCKTAERRHVPPHLPGEVVVLAGRGVHGLVGAGLEVADAPDPVAVLQVGHFEVVRLGERVLWEGYGRWIGGAVCGVQGEGER